MAKEQDINIVSCLEKSDLVNTIISCQKEFKLGHSTKTNAVETLVVESDSSGESDFDSCSYFDESWADDEEVVDKRSHRKTTNNYRRKSNISEWNNVLISDVDKLPYNIDGLVAYQLPFDPNKRMHSSKDGRPWGTWVTSNRKGFSGLRRSARCKGGYKCENRNCLFLGIYKKNNQVQFETDLDGVVSCSTCGVKGTKVHCYAKKIWEFDDCENVVTVYHTGTHACEAKQPISFNDEGLKRKFTDNIKATPRQAADDIIVEALYDKDMTWDDVHKVVDSVIEEGKVKYCKQKTQNEANPFGHSFEAVGELRSRLIEKDPFLLYKINNRNMNGEPSYVFKMSKIQAKLAVAMDCSGNDFLASEYCYFDGTFKRCPGFVTLGAHVYLELLRKIVKIATMECETESTETMVIFWSLLNEVLEKFTGKQGYKFNPIGWTVDEHGGNWASIRAVYGNEAVNKTVSCEFHFKQSVIRQSKYLHSIKSRTEFKKMADKLLTSVTTVGFEQAFDNLNKFINKKPSKRGFLVNWLNWWHQRKEHFARAFKPTGAASVNMSEAYHSAYATTGARGLKLVDAAYKDVALALRLERSLELFGQGVKCNGSGPSGTKRSKRDFQAQSKRAGEYADVLLQETSGDDTVTVIKSDSEERIAKDGLSSSSGSEIEAKKNRKGEEQERCER